MRRLILIFIWTILLTPYGWCQSETILYSFNIDQAYPQGVTLDERGNLIGASVGLIYLAPAPGAYGEVFELRPSRYGWQYNTILQFTGDSDGDGGIEGASPISAVTIDAAGNLYGSTDNGGAYGFGVEYKLSPSKSGNWDEAVMRMNDPAIGWGFAGVVLDSAGNAYSSTCTGPGYIYQMAPQPEGGWDTNVVYASQAFAEGDCYNNTPYIDAAGNLFGSSTFGGSNCNGDGLGCGIIYELSPEAGGQWNYQVIHTFEGADGTFPETTPVQDADGNLYGTTTYGGKHNHGTVFELTKTANGWKLHVLHSFNDNGKDGYDVGPELTWDSKGNLWGVTSSGGIYDLGTVFEMSPLGEGRWHYQIVHDFRGASMFYVDGSLPSCDGGLAIDKAGHIYGATRQGGLYGYGTAFEITP
jgi:uncharacterized repeat protein (TIGR03803 family)